METSKILIEIREPGRSPRGNTHPCVISTHFVSSSSFTSLFGDFFPDIFRFDLYRKARPRALLGCSSVEAEGKKKFREVELQIRNFLNIFIPIFYYVIAGYCGIDSSASTLRIYRKHVTSGLKISFFRANEKCNFEIGTDAFRLFLPKNIPFIVKT